MKRSLLLLLSLFLVLSVFAASPAMAKKVDLALWTKEDGDSLKEIERLAKDFSATHPDITIQVTNYGVEDLRQNFQSAAFAGSGPDLLWTVNDHAGPFATMNIIKPASDIYPASYFSKFVKPGLDAVQMDGKTWGVPISVGNHLMLLYNKKLIKTPPATTDELIKVAKSLTKDTNKDGKPDQYGFVYNLNEPFWLAPWLGGFGGWPLDGRKATLDSKAMVEALEFLHDLKFVHKVVPSEADYNGADALFKEGKAAMLINGDWSLAGYQTPDVKKNVDLGVARIPKVSATGKWPSPMTSGVFFMFPSYLEGERLEAVKEFVDYIVSPKIQLSFVQKFKRLPSVKSVLDDPIVAKDPILKGSSDQMVVGRPMPTVPEMRAAWDAMRPNLEAVMADKATPAAAAKAMQEAAEKAIAEMTK